MQQRRRSISRLHSAVALAAFSTTFGVDQAFGQSGSWTFNGIGDWSDSFGWLGGTIPDGAGNLAAFTGTGALSPLDTLSITLDSNRTIGSLAFSDGDVGGSPAGWRIIQQAANVLTLQQVPDLLGNTPQPTINVANLGTGAPVIGNLNQRIANINTSLGGTMGFNKTNAGTLMLSGDNSALSGTVTMSSGNLLLATSNALGSSTLMTVRTGNFAIRNDSAVNLSGAAIQMQGDHVIGVGNSISLSGTYGSGSNTTHTIGDVTMTNYGVRTITVSGSNGYGLNMSTLATRDGVNLINQGNTGNLLGAGDNNNVTLTTGSGLVTVGTINYNGPGAGTVNLGGTGTFAGNITVTNGITNTGGGSANLVHSGSRTVTVNGSALGGDVYLTGGVTGTPAGLNYQAAVGTLILNTSALASGRQVFVDGGSLVLGATATHNVAGLRMGGATLVVGAGAIPASVDTGAGTIAIGASGITVNTSTQFDPSVTVASVQQTAGLLNGRLDLGSSNRTITVNGSSTLTVNAVVNGSGGIDKQGTGYLTLNGINTFTGGVNVGDGVVAGQVKAGGNAIGATGANVSLGGALRINGIASAGSTTVNNMSVKDTGAHTGVIVDATVGGATTLSVSAFNGREANTNGTFKVVPVTGSMNTNEIVHLATGAPTTPNNVAPFWMAVQTSGSNTQLSFASLTGNRIVSYAGYTTDFAGSDVTKVFDLAAASGQTLTGAKTLYGARIGAGGSMSGSQVLTLGNGDGAHTQGGLILNGGALMGVGTLQGHTNDELVIWSGGTTRNTVSSFVNLGADLTTGGSQDIDFTSTINFGGAARKLTVTGGTANVSGLSAFSGNTTTPFTKAGGGVLAITNSNVNFSGGVTVAGGTLNFGGNGGAAGNLASAPITNNSAVTFNVFDLTGAAAGSFGNNISGSGSVYVNPGTSTGMITLSGALTYAGNTTVQTGVLRVIGGPNRLPATTNLTVLNNATFQLNGNALQTVAGISGTGTIINNAAGQATLTVNGSGTSSFGGSLRNGTGSFALTKSGTGTLILSGAGNFNGTISILGGTLQVDNNTAIQSAGADSNIVLNGGALALNIPNNQNITPPTLFFLGNSTLSVMTNSPVNLGVNQDGAGPGIQGGANSILGNGTVNLVLNGRMLNIGDQAFTGNAAQLNLFSGTFKFDDSNPVNSRVRFTFGGGGAAFTAGAPAATFAFGNGFNIIQNRFGSAVFNMGFVSGGTNTILEGHSNDPGRPVAYNFGILPGDQTFHGQIRDYTTNGAFGITHIAKTGSSSTLTLKNTLSFTGGITVNAGRLFLAPGVNITNSASLVLNGGTLSILPGASFTSPRMIATIGGGAFDVTSFGTSGFNTPNRMTYTGGGTVYGNANHNAGSINPGAIGGAGTLTFANTLNLNNGSVDFDLTAGSANLLGTSGLGSNDVLRVSTSNGLTISSGIVRLNFLGAGTTPPPTLATNQFYPIISFNSTFNGSTSSVFTTAKFRGSFELQQGTGSLASTLGAKIIALGGSTVNLLWKPISTEFNAWDAAIGFTNFTPLAGGGSLFFFSGDSVTFDDTTSIRTVQLTPGLAPTSITVNTSGTYIFTGQGVGSITGSTGLTKNGTGTLFIGGDNDYTGGTTINGGTLVVGDPLSPLLTPRALGGGTATTVFNNDSNFRIISPTSNTFAGPGSAVLLAENTAGGNFVMNPGTHRIILSSSNLPHPWNINLYGSGTMVVERPSLDGNNSHLLFNQGTFPTFPGSAATTVINPFASFTGTIKLHDLTNFVPGSGQGWTQFRDGTILRLAAGLTTTGNPSMIVDLGQGTAGFSLGANGHTMTMGAIRGGPNTFFKQDGTGFAGNASGTYIIAGVGAQYNSTFHGLFRATGNNTTLSASVQLVNVVKSGSLSTLTLTASQPYVGHTIVNGGTLALSSPALSNILISPTITINAGGVLDISGLNGGLGDMILEPNQRLISNGAVVGGTVTALATSTIGGTTFGNPLQMESNSTLSPGNSVGTLTVSNLVLNGQVEWLIELDSTGMDAVVLTGTQTGEISANFQKLNLSIIGSFTPGTFMLLDYFADDPGLVGDLETIFENLVTPEGFAYNVDVVHDTSTTRVNIVFVDNSAQWLVNNDGSWSVASNWTSDGVNGLSLVPNSVLFGTLVSAPRTVTTNSTVGNITNAMTFNSPHKYTVAGTGTITLDAGLSVPVGVLQGSHAITAPIRALKTLAVSTAAGTSLSFGGTVVGAVGAGILKSGAGSATFTRLTMATGSLNVQGGTMIISQKAQPNNVSGTSVFTNMTIAPGAKLDLTNNALILDYAAIGTMLTVLRAELADGRLYSSTVGSNTTLGYRNNATGTTAAGGAGTAGLGLAQVASFGGVAVDGTSVLLRVTYKGDSNLDGIVNVMDLYNLSLNWLSTNGVWAGGDFNYDGLVNQADLTLLAQGWQLGNNNPLPSEDLGAALTAAGIPLNAVPEPSTLALAGVGAAGLLGRRRRRR